MSTHDHPVARRAVDDRRGQGEDARQGEPAGQEGVGQESIAGVKDKIVGAGDLVTSSVSDRTPDSQEVEHKAKKTASVAQESPLGLATSVAVGFIAGMLVASTRVEDQKIESVADNNKAKIGKTGQGALGTASRSRRRRHRARRRPSRSPTRSNAQQIKDSAQQSAQDVGSSSFPDRPQFATH